MLNKLKRYLFRRKTPVVLENKLGIETERQFVGIEWGKTDYYAR